MTWLELVLLYLLPLTVIGLAVVVRAIVFIIRVGSLPLPPRDG